MSSYTINVFFLVVIITLVLPIIAGLAMCLLAEDSCKRLLGFYCFVNNFILLLMFAFQENLVYILDISMLGIILVMVLVLYLIKVWD